MIMLYKSLVHSIIDYGVNVWGLASKTHLDKVQKLQEKCIKSALWKRDKNSNLNEAFRTLNVLPAKEMAKFGILTKNRTSSIKQRAPTYSTRLQSSTKYVIGIPNNKYGARTKEIILPKLFNDLPQ